MYYLNYNHSILLITNFKCRFKYEHITTIYTYASAVNYIYYYSYILSYMEINQNADSTTSYDCSGEFNHNYWNELSDTQHFYYESFLAGDGYIKSSDNTIGVDLAIKDYDWIINYKQNLHIDNKVQIRDTRPEKNSITASIRKKDKQWVTDLKQYGMVPRKTGKESLPIEWCSSEKEAAAILLGIFDSDGTIYKERKSQKYRMAFYGNKHVCNQVNDIIKTYTDIDPNKLSLSNNMCDFIYATRHGAKNDLIKLYDFMYQDKELEHCWLSRKFGIWNAFMIDATRHTVV